MISVIVASYNQCSLLRRAINSVLNQILPNGVELEVIVVDDGSTDGSQEIKKEYPNILWINEPVNKGIMSTYNSGLALCTGKYIAFCDCDDHWIHPYKLYHQYQYMEENPDCGLCTTRVYTETNNITTREDISTDEINKELSFDTLLEGTVPIHAQSYFIRKSVFDKYVYFPKFIKLGFNTWDYPIVLELIHHTRFHCLDLYTAVWNKRMESTTRAINRKQRVRYLLGNYKIKFYYIEKYGCKLSTKFYLIRKILRDIYSTLFKRWIWI